MKKVILLGVCVAFAFTTQASAQAAPKPETCTAVVPASGLLAPWNTPGDMAAAASESAAAKAGLSIGKATRLALLQTPAAQYAVVPEKPGGPVSFGGLVAFDVQAAGTYRVALGSAAWIDVVHDSKAVTSTAHGHGPACTGIHKIVDFPLEPGRYTLQIAANVEPQTTVLVLRLP